MKTVKQLQLSGLLVLLTLGLFLLEEEGRPVPAG